MTQIKQYHYIVNAVVSLIHEEKRVSLNGSVVTVNTLPYISASAIKAMQQAVLDAATHNYPELMLNNDSTTVEITAIIPLGHMTSEEFLNDTSISE